MNEYIEVQEPIHDNCVQQDDVVLFLWILVVLWFIYETTGLFTELHFSKRTYR